MLITSIRHKINAELDTRRSSAFMRYLTHYLHMFAILGLIIPVVIVVDYYCDYHTKDEVVINKFFQVVDNIHRIEYHFYTASYHFLSDVIFFENTNIEDRITLVYTPILKTVTNVIHRKDRLEYICKPNNVYGWPIVIAGLTFIFSIILMIKTWRWCRKNNQIKYDSMINLGIINAILCVFTIISVFFDKLH